MRTRKLLLSLSLSALLAAGADFSMTEKTEITGGALAGAMKVAAKFSKSLDTVTTTSQHFSGDRMVTVSKQDTQIIDLGAETFTHIDHDKKRYSVITFDEWQQAMEKMLARMSQAQKDAPKQQDGNVDADVRYSVDVQRTGKTRQVAGVNAEQAVMILRMTATDKKSGESGSADLVIDSWMGEVPGHAAVSEFYKQFGEKVGQRAMAGLQANPFLQQQGFGQGMAEAAKKMGEMQGVPLLQIVRFVPAGQSDVVATAAKGDSAGQPLPKQEGPSMKEAVVGSVLGGFGGFGRKKKPEPKPEPQPQAGANAGEGVLLEMVTETVSFSTAPVDQALLQIPAGYKEVEHEMKKMLK